MALRLNAHCSAGYCKHRGIVIAQHTNTFHRRKLLPQWSYRTAATRRIDSSVLYEHCRSLSGGRKPAVRLGATLDNSSHAEDNGGHSADSGDNSAPTTDTTDDSDGPPSGSSSSQREAEDASTSGRQQDEYMDAAEFEREFDLLAADVDATWSDLPLEQLRRPGELGWAIDPDGPLSAERYDNVFDKEQMDMNANAINIMGMGSWRLKPVAAGPIQMLVANIEGGWRHLIDDLHLYSPMPREWRYVDSLDPEGEHGGWSYQDLESPPREDPRYPRLQIENRCYRSREFRKLHLEVAHRQDGLEIFHCVMYPQLDFELPIVSMDLVMKDGRASLGIIDPCPVAMDRSLPPAYNQIASVLQQEFGVENNRATPDWGREIFSDHCVMMRPDSVEQLSNFIKYAVCLVRVHLRYAHACNAIEHNRASRMHVIAAAQKRYSEKQLLNSKTRRVLESAFSPDFAEQYMTGLMFDTDPKPKPSETEQGVVGNGERHTPAGEENGAPFEGAESGTVSESAENGGPAAAESATAIASQA